MHCYKDYFIVKEPDHFPKWYVYKVEYDRDTQQHRLVFKRCVQTLRCAKNYIDANIGRL